MSYLKQITMVRNSLTYAMGLQVGDDLSRHLPTLTLDAAGGPRATSVTYGERKNFDELEDNWMYKWKQGTKEHNDAWGELLSFHYEMVHKYLPKEFKYHNTNLPQDIDIETFKGGLSEAIWQSDISWYTCNVEDIQMTYDDKYGGCWEITLTLKVGNNE